MNQNPQKTGVGRNATPPGSGGSSRHPDVRRRRAAASRRGKLLGALTGCVALCGALLAAAVPAHADDDGNPVSVEAATLRSHGAEVQVRFTYRCDEGRSAGVGIVLSQAAPSGPDVVGGAGTGQHPCTGETETVTLTLPAGSGRFTSGAAAAAVSLFTSAPGTPDTIEQFSSTLCLEHGHGR